MFRLNSSNTHISHGSDQYHRVQDALYSLNSSRKRKLENILLKFFNDHRITENERVEFQKTFKRISNHIKQCFPKVIVCLYGSHINGLGNKDSDLDITILFYEGKYFSHLQRSDQIIKLRTIYRYFKEKYLNVIFISKARIPIVKFKTESGVNVDISIDNFGALQSTHLLKKYIDLDSRIIVLAQLLKQVVKLYKIGGAYDGNLSPFGYILLLIHYLQSQGVLPILRKDIDYDANPNYYELNELYPSWRFIEASNSCQDSGIVDLWIGFFKYYTMEFKIRSDIVSITNKTLVSKYDRFWDSYLSIESPLDRNIDVASHIQTSKATKILNSFSDVLLQKGNIDEIFQQSGYSNCKCLNSIQISANIFCLILSLFVGSWLLYV